MRANAIQIRKNGKILAVVGIKKPGVLGGVIEIRKKKGEKIPPVIHLHGLENLPPNKVKYIFWNSEELREGDVISFKIITSRTFTSPKSSSVEQRRKRSDE